MSIDEQNFERKRDVVQGAIQFASSQIAAGIVSGMAEMMLDADFMRKTLVSSIKCAAIVDSLVHGDVLDIPSVTSSQTEG